MEKATLDELKNHLKNNEQYKTVYFNENEEWLFSENPNFPNAVSREDVLAMQPGKAQAKKATKEDQKSDSKDDSDKKDETK